MNLHGDCCHPIAVATETVLFTYFFCIWIFGVHALCHVFLLRLFAFVSLYLREEEMWYLWFYSFPFCHFLFVPDSI